MKVLLINPPRYNGIPVIREERCEITERYSVLPPYSLLQIASLLRNDKHSVYLVDANGEDLTFDELKKRIENVHYEALIFRFTPTTFDWDMKTAKISKNINKNAKTIGICWTLGTVAKEVLKEAKYLDIYVMHEYEVVVPALINILSNGGAISKINGIAHKNDKININNHSNSISDYDSIPIPAYDLLSSFKHYFINNPHGSPFTIMYTSKGCPFSCIYCTVAKTKLKQRSAESILKELRYLKKNHDIKTVSFFDETFTFNKKRVIEIAEGIKNENLNIRWYCNTRVDLVDETLLKVMKSAGCRGISYGIESGSQKILDNAKKRISIKQAENAIKWTKEAGIKVYCSFMFGLPGETWGTVGETIKFVKKTLPTSAQFNVAVPYPGTKLYDIALKKGWIKEGADWRDLYQHESVMRTDELSHEDLNMARKLAYRSLYFNPKWIFQNFAHVIKNPEDVFLATRYGLKITKNYFINKMEHAH